MRATIKYSNNAGKQYKHKPKQRSKMARRIHRKNASYTAWHDKFMSEQTPKKKNTTGAAKKAKKRKAHWAALKSMAPKRIEGLDDEKSAILHEIMEEYDEVFSELAK